MLFFSLGIYIFECVLHKILFEILSLKLYISSNININCCFCTKCMAYAYIQKVHVSVHPSNTNNSHCPLSEAI